MQSKKVSAHEDDVGVDVPERNLIASLIGRAIADVINPAPQQYKRDAEAWLASNKKAAWSFRWCCFQLGLDHQEIRHVIKEQQATGERWSTYEPRRT